MMLDVFSYHFYRYLIPHRADKISILPKFSAPQLFLYFWMLLEYYARTYPLQHPHNLCNAISWRECQKYVNMIWGYLQRVYFKFMMLCYFSKYLLYSFLYFSSQYPLPVFRCPDQMIFVSYTAWLVLLSTILSHISCPGLPSAKNFSSPLTKRGIQVLIFHKILLYFIIQLPLRATA